MRTFQEHHTLLPPDTHHQYTHAEQHSNHKRNMHMLSMHTTRMLLCIQLGMHASHAAPDTTCRQTSLYGCLAAAVNAYNAHAYRYTYNMHATATRDTACVTALRGCP
jgi:hypothetical protein